MAVRKIFISSTCEDLQECRDAVTKRIDEVPEWEWEGIERFGAQDVLSEEFCRKKVCECDVLVGILGERYGSSPEDSDLSYTEIEYNTAGDKGITRLMFVSTPSFPQPAEGAETPDQRVRQQAFRKRVEKRVCPRFYSAHELAA